MIVFGFEFLIAFLFWRQFEAVYSIQYAVCMWYVVYGMWYVVYDMRYGMYAICGMRYELFGLLNLWTFWKEIGGVYLSFGATTIE